MKTSASLRLVRAGSLAAVIAACLATNTTQAAPQYASGTITWDNAITAAWRPTGGPYDQTWTSGNDAVFEGALGIVSVAATGATAASLTFSTSGYTVQNGTLTLLGTGAFSVGTGITATINSALAGTIGMVVEGGGTLNLGGVSTLDAGGDGLRGLVVGASSSNNIVNLSNGGTMGTITANRRSLFIGSTGSGGGATTTSNNVVNFSTPGTSSAPTFNTSGNGTRATIGYASDANELNVSNGAYVAQTNGSGTNTWDMGVLAGADNNKLTVSGAGSTVYFGSNQSLNVGVAGNGNTAVISAGGYFRQSRIGAGTGGGDNNYQLITGVGSQVFGSAGSNSVFELGITAGSVGNSVRVEGGGTLNFGGSGTGRRWAFGEVATADSNFIRVTGPTSTANLIHTGIPLAVGGYATGSTMTDGGDSNHLDVYSGATLNMVNITGAISIIPAGSTALVLLGTNSAFNLGDGTNIGTAIVGTTANFASGVYLKNADGRLNFNNGWLAAGVTGNLVSGAGKIDLKGPAYVSNVTGLSNIISTIIEDSTTSGAAFIKEGAGTLTLNAANTYSGDTTVHGGTLVADSSINASVLNTDSTLVLGRGGKFKFMGSGDSLTPQVMDGLTLNPGGNGIEVNGVGSGGLTLDLRGAAATLGITRSAGDAGGTVDFKATAGILGTTVLVQTVQPNVNGILGAWATVDDGAGLASNDGTDSIVAYAGYSDIVSGGAMPHGATNNYRITGGAGYFLDSTTDVNTLTQNDANAQDVNANAQLLRVGSSGGILITPTGGALTIGSIPGDGSLTAGGTAGFAGELVLGNFSGNALTINSAIADNGAGVVTLTKSGGGAVVLKSAGFYTGGTFVGAGTLTCEAAGAVGSGPLTVSGGTLAMGANNQQVAAVSLTAGAITGAGTLASTVGFALDGSTATSCTAVLTDGVVESVPVSVGLIKSGPGTATLGAANIYSGATEVNAGTLAYGVANAIGAGTVTVNGGVLAMGANSDEVGQVTLTAGAITGSGTLTSTSGFALNGGGATFCTAILAGSGVGLVKSGAGTATLAATNTYSGNTDVEQGTLVLNKASLDDNSIISITSGAFLSLAYTGTDTVKQLFIGGSQAQSGTHGSLTSTATHKSATFTGSGILNVTEGPAVQPALTLAAVPDTFKETVSANSVTGTVSIPVALGSDLVVNLASSDPTVATMTSSVTIFAGFTNAEFWIVPVNNPLVQSARTATLTASASGYDNATTLVTVTEGGYDSWKTANAGGETADLDYDKDGVSNGVEYFMGQTGTTFTPNPSVVNGKVSWPYDANTAGTGMTYQVMTSTDLVIWSPVDPQPVPAAGLLEYTLPTGNPARFVRLEVTTTP